MTPTRRWIVACAAAGFILRLAFALVYWVGEPLTHDEREYLALGRSVARGEGFRYPADEPMPGTGQQFGRAPGYPLFLAALRVSAPVAHAPRRVQIAQAALGTIGVWLIAAIAGRAAGPRVAVAAGALAAIYPPLVWMPAYVLSETLSSVLVLGAALALDVSTGNDRGARLVPLVASAVLTGLAILVRPATVFVVPLAAAWLVVRRRRGSHASAVAAAVFVIAALLCVAPWLVRNHAVYGRWMIASEGGVTFWTGNHPLARGEGDLAANPDLKRADLVFRATHPALTPEQLEPLYYRDAFAWIRSHPLAWTRLLSRKAFYTIVPAGPSYAVHSAKYRVASQASYLLLLILAAAGLRRWLAVKKNEGGARAPAALWLAAAATIISGLVFFPQERFRIPVIDPALIVTGAFAAAPRTYERTGRHSNV